MIEKLLDVPYWDEFDARVKQMFNGEEKPLIVNTHQLSFRDLLHNLATLEFDRASHQRAKTFSYDTFVSWYEKEKELFTVLHNSLIDLNETALYLLNRDGQEEPSTTKNCEELFIIYQSLCKEMEESRDK